MVVREEQKLRNKLIRDQAVRFHEICVQTCGGAYSYDDALSCLRNVDNPERAAELAVRAKNTREKAAETYKRNREENNDAHKKKSGSNKKQGQTTRAGPQTHSRKNCKRLALDCKRIPNRGVH